MNDMTTEKQNKRPNVPPLRFPEFTDEWNRTELGNHITIYSGSSPNLIVDENGEIPYYKVEQLNWCNKFLSDTPYLSKRNKLTLPPNCIVFSKRGAAILTNKVRINPFAINIDTNLMGLSVNDSSSLDYNFLYYFILKAELGKIADTSTIPQINNIHINPLIIPIPSIGEQRKVAKFISLLDRRIVVQSKIIEQLESLMGGIIDGSLNKCKYRLSHFSSEWKSKKLGDLGVFIRGLSYDNNSVVDDSTKTLVIRSNNISQGKEVDLSKDVVYVDKVPEEEQMLQECDIVFCMANGSSALVGKNSVYFGNYDGAITVGAFCGIYRGKSKLTRWMLNSSKYQRTIYNQLQGGNGAIANLKAQDILGLSFDYPSEYEEEMRLDTILSTIEKKIVKEERLLKLYDTQKQHLLSQMFI